MNFKRILAYLIDVTIVSVVVAVLSMINFVNPTQEQYNAAYLEYEEVSNQILASESNINIDPNNILKEMAPHYYKVQKYLLPRNIIQIFSIIAYFIVFNLLNDGQTLGKKIMKIKIAANKGTLTWKNYLIRNIILNELLINVLICVMIFVLKDIEYYIFSMILTYISATILIVDILMMLFRKDKRSLHDILSNTKVIEA